MRLFEEIDKGVEYPRSDKNLQARDISPPGRANTKNIRKSNNLKIVSLINLKEHKLETGKEGGREERGERTQRTDGTNRK